ncbi:unnamed protein product [Discula destructiva]
MFANLLRKEEKHDEDMTVWVPKGVYNSVEPLWDARYAWHPIPVDDSLPMDQTSFIQVNTDEDDSEAQHRATTSSSSSNSHESLAPDAFADTASVHSAVSTLGDLPDFTDGGKRNSSAQAPRKADFGFPVRQMSWNTSRRKRAAQLQRQKSRDKYGVPNKVYLAPPAPEPAAGAPVTPAPRASPRPDARQASKTAMDSWGGDFVMFAL